MLTEFLKNYRRKHNLSQIDMAIKIKTSQGYYSLIESGKRKPVSFVLIKKIANATEVTPDFIVSLL